MVSVLKGVPLVFRLYLRLLLVIFGVELATDGALHFSLTGSHPQIGWEIGVIDAALLGLLCCPFIWWLVVHPLRKAFSAERARFEQLVDQVVDAVVVMDGQGRIEAFNTAAELAFGYREEEVRGLLPDMLVEEPAGYVRDILEQAASGRVPTDCIHHEVMGRHRDGSRFPISISVSKADMGARSSLILIVRDISPIREQELRQQRMLSLLEATLEATADAIVAVDWQRRILTYNRRLVELLNIPADILASRDSIRMVEYLQGLVEDPESFRARIDELYHQPDTVSFDTLRFRDGRIIERASRPQLLNGQSVGRVWSYRDLTDREKALAALSDSEKRFREIFEQTEDAIVLLSGADRTVLDVNPTAEQLFGTPKAELVGTHLAIFRHEADRAAFQESVAALRGDRMIRMDRVPGVRPDGTGIHVSIHGKLIRLREESAVYCTFRDISERVRLEEESHSIQSRLIMTNKMTSLGLLVAGVAHEINNPNNYIMGNAQLLERVWADLNEKLQLVAEEHGSFTAGGLDSDQLRTEIPGMLAGLVDGSRRIRDIINNLKSYARQGGGLPDTEVDINRVISLAMTLLNHHINRLTDRFHLELAEALPTVKGSPQQLEQVVINLVMNALQSLPSRECGVWVVTAHDPGRGEVLITVRDEGGGILPELLDRVNEPFFTTRLDSGGTGLGLSITSSIAAAHGGSMTISSEPEVGTTVTVSLPATPAS